MRLLLLAALVLLARPAAAQAPDRLPPFAAAFLQDGVPAGMETLFDGMHLTGVRHAWLEAGVDTLRAAFGTASQEGQPGQWAALLVHGVVRTAQLGFAMEADTSGVLRAEVVFALEQEGVRLPVELGLIPSAGVVLYRWGGAAGAAPGGKAAAEPLERPVRTGEPMPDVTVARLDGAPLRLSSLRGKTVVLNWWATSCGPCIAEMPGLNLLVDAYGARGDVAFVAIADDAREDLEAFLQRRSFAYTQTLASDEARVLFGRSYPHHVIVDPAGTVVFYTTGGTEQTHQLIEAALRPHLPASR